MGDVDALELIQLGRALVKIGEHALRGGRTSALPNGPSLVLRDVFAHPDSPINAICDRTALPQSYVSESVARLRDQGLLATRTDPADKRRTLVRVSGPHRRTVARKGRASIEEALVAALADTGGAGAREVVELLETLSRRVIGPGADGPILAQLADSVQGSRA